MSLAIAAWKTLLEVHEECETCRYHSAGQRVLILLAPMFPIPPRLSNRGPEAWTDKEHQEGGVEIGARWVQKRLNRLVSGELAA